jgi:tetratricopeptide (TPR) repeat protein
MPPEQAAADPHTDHRADLYAVGVLAYEMLTGRPPFTGTSPQAVLAAQVTQQPEPITKQRASVPPALAALVMRCLEKKAADRYQTAEELLVELEAMGTPSGGLTSAGAGPPISSGMEAAIRRADPVRVAALFGTASLVVLALVYLLMLRLGLPNWVFAGALALIVVGLPIMLVTGVVERHRALARTTGAALPPPPGMRRWFTWRRSLIGGALAFSGLVTATAIYMGMRLLGIGPVGTLVASGVLKAREPLLLASFDNRTADSTLGPSLSEAFRVDLSQSPTIKLVDVPVLVDALRRMQRSPGTSLDLLLAREVAQREGIKAVVTGQIDPVGKGYVLSASLVAAADGTVLAAVRETAEDDRALIRAIDGLSRSLRERIGESLRTIRADQPLAHVTTGSLAALRKYSQALAAVDRDGDMDRSIALLREATVLDTGFAMAYRKLSAELGNSVAPQDQVIAVTRHAYVNRGRLPELERYLVTATYYERIEYDPTQVVAAYRSALELDPDNVIALNNLAFMYNDHRRWHEAESLAVRATEVGSGDPQYVNAVRAMVAQGRFAAAGALIERGARVAPGHGMMRWLQTELASAQFDSRTAAVELTRLLDEQRASQAWQAVGREDQAAIAQVQGRLGEAAVHMREAMAIAEQRGVARAYLANAVELGWLELRYRNRPAAALQTVKSALARHPLASLAAVDRPYVELAELFASAGRLDRARQLLGEYAANVPEGMRRSDAAVYAAQGAVAVAEGQLADALESYRARYDRDQRGCVSCGWYELASVYDRMGRRDSALAIYERVVTTPGLGRALYPVARDAYGLAPTYKRLGDLHEERGDRVKALEYYGRFVNLWKDADPELQPVVRDVRARMARLAGEH